MNAREACLTCLTTTSLFLLYINMQHLRNVNQGFWETACDSLSLNYTGWCNAVTTEKVTWHKSLIALHMHVHRNRDQRLAFHPPLSDTVRTSPKNAGLLHGWLVLVLCAQRMSNQSVLGSIVLIKVNYIWKHFLKWHCQCCQHVNMSIIVLSCGHKF